MHVTVNEVESFARWMKKIAEAAPEKPYYGLKFPCHYTDFLKGGEVCPVCNGIGSAWKDETHTVLLYCLCNLLKWMDGLPSMPFRDTFEEMIVPPYKKLEDLDTRIGGRELVALVNYLPKWQKTLDSQIFISGGKGSGKTHILKAMKNRLGALAVYIGARKLAGLSRQEEREFTIDDLVKFMIAAPVLLLDDLGAEYSKDWTWALFERIYDARYGYGYPTIITSNYGIGELVSSPNQSASRLGSRLSAVREGSKVIQLSQGDYRNLKGIS